MRLTYLSLLALAALVSSDTLNTKVDEANSTVKDKRGKLDNFGLDNDGWIQAHYLLDCKTTGTIPNELLAGTVPYGKGSDNYMLGPRVSISGRGCRRLAPFPRDNIGVNWGTGTGRVSRLLFYASGDCSGPYIRYWDCPSKDKGMVYGNCNDGKTIRGARSMRSSYGYSKGGWA